MKISTCDQKPFPHGIDITAPGGLDRLIKFHRASFGDAQMNANGGTESGGSGSGESGTGDGSDGGQGGADGESGGSGDSGDGDRGLKSALDAERAASKKATADLKAAEARVKELEDASKSEEQRTQDAQEQLKSEHATLTRNNEQKDSLIERYRVAAAKGLDLKAAERLQGSTREEIEQDADDWISMWGTGSGRQQEQERRGDPGQGPRGGAQESSYAQGADRAKARFGDDKK